MINKNKNKVKLLIVTQKVDENDDILGFFHGWIKEFAKHCEHVTVICLYEGQHHLPNNVKVLSLGKEKYFRERCDLEGGDTPTRSLRRSVATEKVRVGLAISLLMRLKYLTRFYRHIWRERKNYDSVFVHMNQEYVLLGGIFWKFFGKKIAMWRNHPVGTHATRIAILFSNNVFHTSQFAFSATLKKAKIMPAGIDVKKFSRDKLIERQPNSVLFLGRISPVKKVDIFIEALNILDKSGVTFTVSIYGDAADKDREYYKKIRKQAVVLKKGGKMIFHEGVPNTQTPLIYNQYKIFVNATQTGSFDKTILEAMACRMPTLVSNKSFQDILSPDLMFEENDAENLAKKLEALLSMSEEEREGYGKKLQQYVIKEHSLGKLVEEVLGILNNVK